MHEASSRPVPYDSNSKLWEDAILLSAGNFDERGRRRNVGRWNESYREEFEKVDVVEQRGDEDTDAGIAWGPAVASGSKIASGPEIASGSQIDSGVDSPLRLKGRVDELTRQLEMSRRHNQVLESMILSLLRQSKCEICGTR